MIKTFYTFTLLLSISSLNADFLLYMQEDRYRGIETYCIKDYYYANNRIYFLQSNDTRYDSERLSNYSNIEIKAGYILDQNNNCILASSNTSDYETTSELDLNYINSSALGLSQEYYNTLMALSGIIISFIFLYGLARFI